MAKLQGFRIKNYKALKEISMGRLWNLQKEEALTDVTAVIGKNGVGKSSLFDALGFLSDCLRTNVEEACDARGRGGFERIHSKESEGPLEFEIYYKEDNVSRPITYELAIDADKTGRPYVSRERLRQRRAGQKHGRPFSFLLINDGKGVVWKNNEAGLAEDEDEEVFLKNLNENNEQESAETERIELADNRRLGIATLGAMKQHPRISAFRSFLEGWYLSYFTPDAARSLPLAGPQKHLNIHGDNLGNVVQFMEREYPKKFAEILKRISDKIPGIDKIDTYKTPDGRLLLRFNDQGFQDPFYAQQMSDGTLKLFAYLLLLEDPYPPPFICIEEPENGLYNKLFEFLVTEFRAHANGRKGSPQILMTTHQPYLVDFLFPQEVWQLEKGGNGFSSVHRISKNANVKAFVKEGLPLGGLWYSDYFDI